MNKIEAVINLAIAVIAIAAFIATIYFSVFRQEYIAGSYYLALCWISLKIILGKEI